ncbi:MAG: hypothetical protein AAF533_29335 [Acidobacteriota bacterium]
MLTLTRVIALALLLPALPVAAATFSHEVDHQAPSSTVVVSSELVSGSPGAYVQTVTVTLASGAVASQSRTGTWLLGSVEVSNFTFAGPVMAVSSIVWFPDDPVVGEQPSPPAD